MPPIQIKLDDKELKASIEGVKKLGKEAVNAVIYELKACATDILGKSVKNLEKNKSVATSNLSTSGRIEKVKDGYTVGYLASYAWIVEFGRKSGSYVPIKPLMAWVHKKRIAFVDKVMTRGKNKGSVKQVKGVRYEQRVKSIAIAISKSIQKKGINPKPFLVPAFNDIMKGFNNRVINAINNVLK